MPCARTRTRCGGSRAARRPRPAAARTGSSGPPCRRRTLRLRPSRPFFLLPLLSSIRLPARTLPGLSGARTPRPLLQRRVEHLVDGIDEGELQLVPERRRDVVDVALVAARDDQAVD